MSVFKKVCKWFMYACGSYLVLVGPAMASEGAAAASGDSSSWMKMFSAGITIAIAAFGGALGQGKAAAAALESIGRNPSAQSKIFVPMIVALALIESLVIYALVVIFSKM